MYIRTIWSYKDCVVDTSKNDMIKMMIPDIVVTTYVYLEELKQASPLIINFSANHCLVITKEDKQKLLAKYKEAHHE